MPDHAKALLQYASQATPFLSKNGEPCASIPGSVDHRTVVALRSAGFRDWLIAKFYKDYDTAPSAAAFRAAIRTLEARARYDNFPTQRVTRRLGFEGEPYLPSKITLDLANHAGEILEITSRGWTIANNLRTAFHQSTTTLALPHPQQPPATNNQPLTTLRTLLNLPNDAAWRRAAAWLTSALRPTGPYPILILEGPAGSGKSIFARALRALIDPSAAPVHRLPARDRDVLELALHNWILIFDQVNRVPYKISEALCAISSGDALEVTQRDFRDPLVFEVARPMILIAPHDETQRAWAPPRSLANRTLTIQLQPIAHPRPESAIWSDFEAFHPAALAELSKAVSTAIARIRDIDLHNVSRFPDAAAWAAAAAPALGLDEAAIVDVFANPVSIWAGSDPLREAIHAFLQSSGTWSGEAAGLLNQLRAQVPLAALPSTPKALSQALPRVSGIDIVRNKGAVTLTLTKSGDMQTITGLARR
jgi:putative DNA primase/helicase